MGLAGPYLTPAHLKGFDSYKYSAVDTSPLSKYVTHPFWNAVVELFPKWVAPNLITFSGGLLLMAILFMLGYYDWDYYTTSNDLGLVFPPIPSIVWLLSAIFHFTAHTLDGIDGKQARRTGSSTPLGELFDHGIDSVACILLPVCLMSMFGRGNLQWGGTTYDAFFPCMAVLAGFYLSHWEKYVTGVLYLPWIYDIVQLGCALAYLMTYLYGVELWHFSVPPGIKSAVVVKWLLIVGFFGSIPMTLWNIYDHYNAESGRRKLGLLAALEPWSPFLMMSTLWTVWVFASPTEILEREPRLLLITIGVNFSNITCRLIIAQMSSHRSDLFNMLLVPLSLGVCLSICFPSYELVIFYVVCIIINLAQLDYAVSVVNELCDHFKIYCFSLVKRSD